MNIPFGPILVVEDIPNVRELLAVNRRISAVYMLKDQLKMIYHYRRRGWAKKALDHWCEMAAEVNHPDLRRCQDGRIADARRL